MKTSIGKFSKIPNVPSPPDLFSVAGRVVVVTGGLGQLGRQFSSALMAHGARVAVVDIADPKTSLAFPADPDEQACGRFFRADVTNREVLQQVLTEIEKEWETPYGLINNAALDSPPHASAQANSSFESYADDLWDAVVSVNLKGVFLCSQVFGGAMARAGRGSIINICSIYGLVSPDQRIYEYRRTEDGAFYKPASYSATKGALPNLTRYLATYWAKQGVRVNTLTLGGVFNKQDAQFLEHYCARVPMGRMAQETEYNGAILFLLSSASSYMTGANLVIDGGWTAW